MIGKNLAHYEILSKLGEGGMGEVYRARDTKLRRDVALKLLPAKLAGDPERRARFEREAAAVAALNHPNIVTIHSIEEAEGLYFITMELVEGRTLEELIVAGGAGESRFLAVAESLADALAAAHAKGIIHRDLKPQNIMLDGEERLKILDFGLAKLYDVGGDTDGGGDAGGAGSAGSAGSAGGGGSADSDPSQDTVTADAASPIPNTHSTQAGQVVGTLAYMSPEQAEGKPLDHRSDLFSLGIVLYELAAGERPFQGDTGLSTVTAILRDHPAPVATRRKDFPKPLSAILNRLLEKDPDRRYATAHEVAQNLSRYRQSQAAARTGVQGVLRRPQVAVPLGLVLIAVLAFGALTMQRQRRADWARNVAIPEIQRLLGDSSHDQGLGQWEAYQLAREVQEVIPEDPVLRDLLDDLTQVHRIHTVPPGVNVYAKPYAGPDLEYAFLGTTPMDSLRYFGRALRLKLEKPGHETVEDLYLPYLMVFGSRGYVLPEEGSVPAGQAFFADSAGVIHHAAAPAGIHLPGIEHLPAQHTGNFLMDRTEVTNAQYKEFIDAGGYRDPAYWGHPFAEPDGAAITYEEAMAQFVDRTGLPGPSTWEQGAYPEGQDEHPVAGISWFEAAAYAAWAGKHLPTVYHWDHAAFTWASGYILPFANFGSGGTVPVGSTGSLNRGGCTDLAGNVREWCFNKDSRLGRFILGGGYNDPPYAFNDAYAQSPFNRAPTNGVRCMQYLHGADGSAGGESGGSAVDRTALEADINMPFRDFMNEPGISDETFALYLKQFDYDPAPLNAEIEERRETEDYIRETVVFAAAYGGERMTAYVFLPKNAPPPYETVVYFPGSNAIHAPSSKDISLDRYLFLLRSGRAFVYPVYKSTFERQDDLRSDYAAETNQWKDHVIMWQKDVSRTIDYLETREDIDAGRLAYFGASWGAAMAPMMVAPEPRFKTAIVLVAGLLFHKAFPEVEPVHFLPRITMPVLMLNGKYDFFFPYETAQVPFYELLGTPEEHKRLVVNESGHSFPATDMAKEMMAWLDRYLAPAD